MIEPDLPNMTLRSVSSCFITTSCESLPRSTPQSRAATRADMVRTSPSTQVVSAMQPPNRVRR